MHCRTGFDLFYPILLALSSILASQPSLLAAEELVPTVSLAVKTVGSWRVVESSNFRCCCQLPEPDARRLAECCEIWRCRLRKTWITDASDENWQPKCEVCVHSHREAYNDALRRPGDVSVGSTSMNFDQGRTVFRRIDVRADAGDWSNAALPHELTHVVLGERFGGHALPRWADEGIAMLSESVEKQRERLVNLRQNLSRGLTMPMAELVRTDRLPAQQFRDAFYGQSVALTSCLIQKSTPAEFADFLDDLQRLGLDQALKQYYQLNGLADLQTDWDRWTRQPLAVEFVNLPLHKGIAPIFAAANDR